MLAELGINSDESEAGHSNNSSASDDLSMTNSSNVLFVDEQTTPKAEVTDAPYIMIYCILYYSSILIASFVIHRLVLFYYWDGRR